MSALKAEFEKAKAENFTLRFRYPTEAERKTMQTVNRDMSKADQDRSNKRRNNLAEIVASLEAGESFMEDFPEDLVRKLENFVAKKSRRKRK